MWMDEILHHVRNYDGFPVNTNKQSLLPVSKWSEMDFAHPQFLSPEVLMAQA